MTNVTQADRKLLPGLVYAALSVAVISSLGLLLIPTIASQMHVTEGTAQWVLTVNLLIGAIATPILGRLSDGPFAKRLLIITLLAILAGSVIAATAPTFGQLLVGRSLQGFSYAVVPMTITLLRRHAHPTQVGAGISALSVTAATGVGIGYPLTGIIAASLDFRFAFWFGAVFVASALIVTVVVVPNNDLPKTVRPPFDYLGATLLGIGLGALLIAISEGATWGWGDFKTLAFVALAVVAILAWIFCELRSRHPLIRLDLLKYGDVMLANGTAVGLGSAMYIGLSVVSLVAQAPKMLGYGLDLPLFWAGFVMLPLSVGSQVSSRLSRAAVQKISSTALLPVGAGLVTLSNTFMLIAHDSLWQVVVGMFFFGLGIGTTFAAMPTLISRSVIVAELGSAVGFNAVLRTLGGSVGSAVAGAILASHLAPSGAANGSGIDLAFGVSAAACGLVFVVLALHTVVSVLRHRHGKVTTTSAEDATVAVLTDLDVVVSKPELAADLLAERVSSAEGTDT
jgi:MFS family permease